MPVAAAAAAIVGSTLVSAYSANKAASQAASAQKKGLEQSNALAQQANDIASTTKMISDYGLQDKISNENLAAMIANITAGQATNTQNAYGNIGAANAAGTMGVANAVQGGLQMGLATGAFGALGGGGSGGGGAGATVNGYTGDAMKNWVAKQ